MPSDQKETFSYHLPSLGTVNPELHAESAALYRFLLRQGEVDRLKTLDHLGTIRLAWEGAHHPRWEYVISILHLVDRCASSDTPQIHLKSRVTLAGARISSGAELLKCWALLSNIGHLHGTFAMERAFLFSLSPAATRALLKVVDPDDRSWASRIIEEARVYQFFQVLGVIRLEDLMESAKLATAERRRWRSVNRSLISPATAEQVDALRAIYRNVRRLAFLALDSHYTPAVARLDLGRIMSDPARLTSLVLHKADTEDDLRGLEQFLTHEIYLGRPVLRVVARHESRMTDAMRRTVARDADITKTIRKYARARPPELLRLIEEDYEPVTRLAAWVAPPFDRLVLKRRDVREEQARADAWAHRVKRDVRAVIWTPAYGGDEWVLQTHAPPSATESRGAAWRYAFQEASALHQQLTQEWSRWTPNADALLLRVLFGSFARELIESALDVLVRTPARWEFIELPGFPTIRLHDRVHLRRAFEGSSDMGGRSRYDERRGLSLALRWRPNQYAAAATPLEAFNLNGRVKMAEFDGIIAEGHREAGLALTFVEVKRQARGSRSAAEKSLINKLGKFAWREGVRSEPLKSDRRSSLAWAFKRFTVL